jgi:serine/threonine protein kinase
MTERSIFLAALAWNDPARRAAYLDGACAGDADLRRRVEALLHAHGGDPRALGERPDAAPSAGGAGEVTRAGDETPGGEPIGLGFLEPSGDPESLGRLGHYDVREVLGRGGFGVVLKAFDEKLHPAVAVKVLAPYLAASATARQRFLREARAAAAVRHENVVDIHAVEDAPVPHIVMEYVAGETLQRRLDRGGPLPLAEVLRVGAQAARGLAAIHAGGRVHRDIKPANILLEAPSPLSPLPRGERGGGEGGRVKITDFGLARGDGDASLTQSGYAAGTPLYMAPEQAMGETADHRADLFSLGSTLYALCTGQPPFRAGSALGVLKRVSEDQPRPIREFNPDVPAWFCAVIARLLAKRPEDRFQSAAEVADLLENPRAEAVALAAAPPEVAPPPAEEDSSLPSGWSRRRSRWIVAATTAAALVAALAVAEAAGVVHVARTVARLFASSSTAVAGDTRPVNPPPEAAPPQAVADRQPPRPPDNGGEVVPPPLAPLPPPVVEVTERTPITLPWSFDDVRTGAGGRLLIFHRKDKQQLAIVDACAGRLVQTIPLSENAVYAAGREKLLVVLRQGLIQRWDLRTFKQDEGSAVRVPGGVNVLAAVMGCDSAGPLALWTGEKVILMDVGSMKPLGIEWPEGLVPPPRKFEMRASADGRTLIAWQLDALPSDLFLLRPAEHRSIKTDSLGRIGKIDCWAMPGADGQLVFRSDHQVANASLKPYLPESPSDSVMLPTADPRYFLTARGQEVAVCTSWNREPVLKVRDDALAGMASDVVDTRWFLVNHGEPRVRYLPDAHLLVFLPEGNRQVIVRPFDLIGELNKSPGDYLFIASLPNTRARAGRRYTYAMEVHSRADGLTFQLQGGPKGMTISDKGELRWDVPAGLTGASDVIVNVSNRAGKSVVQSFEIEVE